MRRTQRGFTLVEILVSLAIAGLLVSLVYGAIRVGQRSVRALDTRLDQAEVMRIGWEFLHTSITHAGPAADPARPFSRSGFEGNPDQLVFIATMPSYVGLAGPMRISFGRVATPEGAQLLLTREPLDEEPVATQDTPLEQAVLVDRLADLHIDYFGQTDRGDPPAWYSTWGNMRRLPNLVRIRVEPSDGPAWPELIAAPRDGTAPLDDEVVSPGGDAEALSTGDAQ